ncbi:MAG TPA: PorP/SprF family type IX secretion system membrane protein [Sunxiuqinia sp.]|nr:PorP/SprF family type IX secretion system membrane protein [Sunxiuqinia sp.]
MKKVLLLILLLGYCIVTSGQDAEYSQFYANPLYLNPGFTGTSSQTRLVMNYRNQWPQKGNTFVNYSVSFDRYSSKLSGGFGFQIQNNVESNGLVETSSAYGFYAHHIKIDDRFFMDAGLQAGIVYKKLDYGNLIFPDMIDQITGETTSISLEQPENESLVYPDFGLGALGQYDAFFFGISLMHLSQPDESIFVGDQKGKRPMRLTIHAGSRTHRLHRGLLSKEFTLSPNIIYQQQGSFKQINFGMYMLEKSLAGGIWYRQNLGIQPDAVMIMLGVMRKSFKIGYSFDYTLSKLANYSTGSHEISLSLFLGKTTHDRKALMIPSL